MFVMETMERKQPRRRSFTPEFKAEIVERCRAGDRTIGQVARDFDLTETAVRAWVTLAETDAGERPGLTTDERAELARLRRENRYIALVDAAIDYKIDVLARAVGVLERIAPSRLRDVHSALEADAREVWGVAWPFRHPI
jgi:transposase